MEESSVVAHTVGYCDYRNGITAIAVVVSALSGYFFLLLLFAEDEEVENFENACSVENKQHGEPGNRL